MAGIQANVTTVASNNSNVTSVANNASNINTVAGAITNVNNVGSNISHVNTVSGAIANVNTVATNITNVNAFANTYFIGSSAPSGGTIGSGDLWYDTNTSQMKVYNGSAWVTFVSTYDTDATFTYANADDSLSVNKTFKAPAVKINGADAASQGFAVAMAIAL